MKMALTLTIGVALSSLNLLRAERLDLSSVSATAKWLIHVDFDAMRDSAVGKKFAAKMEQVDPRHGQRLGWFRGLTGMDPRHDLHGVTVYGPEPGEHRGVMLLHAKFDQERVMAMANKLPNYEKREHGEIPCHCWSHEHHGKQRTLAVAFLGDDKALLAGSIDDLRHGLDALHEDKERARAESPLAGRVPPGTTILMRAVDVSSSRQLVKHSPLARKIESFRFVSGEHDGISFFRGRIVASDESVVEQFEKICEGGIALAEIHNRENEVGQRLIDGVQLRPKGETFTVVWTAAVEDVWAIADRHITLFAEKAKRARERRMEWQERAPRTDSQESHEEETGPGDEDF